MVFKFFIALLVCWGGRAALLCAQPAASALAADSSRWPPALTSGRPLKNFSWSLAPGGSYALRFAGPAGKASRLRSVCLHLLPFGRRTAQGQVRVRVVGVAPDGSPADDQPLLPPRLLPEATLQALSEPLVLTWPAAPLVVPAAGFFVIVEGLGEFPDEYIISSPRVVLAGKGYHHVGRRGQPAAPPRLLSTWSIPSLAGARRTGPQPEFWMRGGELPTWRAFPESKHLPLLEVGLDQ